MSLLPVADALAAILEAATPVEGEEHVPLRDAPGHTLARDLASTRDQPPFPASAMDGYAVRAADLASPPTTLRLIGESAAGHGFSGAVGPGEALRIFTGAPMPDGADTVTMQENTRREGDGVVALQAEPKGRHVRFAGIDFRAGDVLLQAGTRLAPRHLALAAAMNHPALPVRPKPRIAVIATGDELVLPGSPLGPGQIVASNTYGVAAMAEAAGAEALDLGIASDRIGEIEAALAEAERSGARVIVTLGGASVGDHDLVRPAMEAAGFSLGFWKIAMRPGKPLMFGRRGPMLLLGLPGNPVSSLVCAHLFLLPLIARLSGRDDTTHIIERATLGRDWPVNDERADYVRATLKRGPDGWIATPFERQDSSLLGVLGQAGALVVRPPHAPAAMAGDACEIMLL